MSASRREHTPEFEIYLLSLIAVDPEVPALVFAVFCDLKPGVLRLRGLDFPVRGWDSNLPFGDMLLIFYKCKSITHNATDFYYNIL
jgi:hypothetical protein